MSAIDDLLANAASKAVRKSKTEMAQEGALVDALQSEVSRLRRALKASSKPPKKLKVRKGKAARHELTVVIPDSHGEHIDLAARDAFLADLARIRPERIVMLGDHLDCGGTFNAHQRTYTHEMTESYDADVDATNEFLDLIQAAAPDANIQYVEGNHEQHCERFLARNFHTMRDADMVLSLIGPEAVLRLKERGISYYRSGERYQGLSIPGTIRNGKLFYTHGIACGKHATATHLERFGASVMHGHTHTAQAHISRTVTSDGIGAWCPGTLAKLQPSYMHTNPTRWSLGYGLVTTNVSTERFAVMLVPIIDGRSMLMTDAFAGRAT